MKALLIILGILAVVLILFLVSSCIVASRCDELKIEKKIER